MKLKSIFLIFNIIIIFSFLFVFFMPVFFLGWEYSRTFWTANWYLAAIFVVVLGILNGYFVLNWSLFTALEREDWRRTAEILEHRVYTKGRASAGNVRLLINAYVVTSMVDRFSRLERTLAEKNPKLVNRFCLLFGIPYLLSNDGDEIVSYYSRFQESVSGTVKGWVEWHIAFGLMLKERIEDAREKLIEIARNCTDDLLCAFTVYLLDPIAPEGTDGRSVVDDKKGALKERYTRERWQKFVEKRRDELHILVLNRLLNDIEDWLYEEKRGAGTSPSR